MCFPMACSRTMPIILSNPSSFLHKTIMGRLTPSMITLTAAMRGSCCSSLSAPQAANASSKKELMLSQFSKGWGMAPWCASARKNCKITFLLEGSVCLACGSGAGRGCAGIETLGVVFFSFEANGRRLSIVLLSVGFFTLWGRVFSEGSGRISFFLGSRDVRRPAISTTTSSPSVL